MAQQSTIHPVLLPPHREDITDKGVTEAFERVWQGTSLAMLKALGEQDILYGDYHEDALKPAEELDSKGKLMNASELDGDDIIVGGAGVDKIDSGEGQNVAASGDLSSVILNAELDEMHTFLDYDEDDLPI